jgi:hypothetical protein
VTPPRRPVCAPAARVFQIAQQTDKESIMKPVPRLAVNSIICGITAIVLAVAPAIAVAESVTGHGKVLNGGVSPSQISVDAWRDIDGFAQGFVTFIGDVALGSFPKGGLADPWFLDVVDLEVAGDTAYVRAVVVHSLFPVDIGTEVNFIFIDNSAIGAPDEIETDILGGGPIVAGNITVTD